MKRRWPFILFWSTLVVATVANGNNIQLAKGVSDVVIQAGRPFKLTLPSDAFSGPVVSYWLSEAGADRLPDWLEWDQHQQTLFAIAEPGDVGPYYISVHAYGPPSSSANGKTHVDSAQDVFSIQVNQYGSDSPKCGGGGDEDDNKKLGAHLVLFLDRDLQPLSASARFRLLQAVNDNWWSPTMTTVAQGSLLPWHDVEPMLLNNVVLTGESDLNAIRPTLRARQAVVLYNFRCRQPFSTEVSDALNGLKKRLVSQPQLTIPADTGRSRLSATMVAWALTTDLRLPRTKRQAFYNDRAVQSEYGQIGKSTDAFGVEIFVTPEPRRPWFSVRPTSRIDYKPAVVTTSPPSRTTAHLRPTVRLESTKSETTTATTTTVAAAITKVPTRNRRPELRSSLGTVICYKGVLCEIRIPDDTFHDDEDGSTVTLKLSLQRLDHENQPDWIYLDSLDRTLFGISLETGKWHYSLTAADTQGEEVSDAFAVQVLEMGRGGEQQQEGTPDVANHMFTLTLAEQFGQLRKRPNMLVRLISRLASYFDDPEATTILVHSLRAGSVVLEWSNRTLLRDQLHCPRLSIERLAERMQKKNGEVRKEFVSFMRPEFTPKFVSITYDGVCVAAVTTKSTAAEVGKKQPTVVSEPEAGDTTLLSTLIPALIILILLLFAGVMICVYYRKGRRAGKRPEDSERKYLAKGTPIIFPDEVDASDECTAASPMLLKEEKAPLTATAAATELSSFQPNGLTTANATHKQPTESELSYRQHQYHPSATLDGLSSDDGATTITDNPLYRPPPPFESVRTAERSPKPKQAHPAFREPPPYVPP